MASESSSAVLDLTDDPAELDAPAGAGGRGAEGAPLIMEHGQDIAVKVDAPLKQLCTLETYVSYRVRCVCARWPAPPHARRRYNHFKALHKRLSCAHEWVTVPPLPPLHSARQQLDRYSPGFVACRTLALDAFLDRVARHPILTHSEDLRIFLTAPDDELDKLFKNENSALNLWGLSSALYPANNESKVTNGARVRDPEFTSAAEYLTCVEHKLTSLGTLVGQLHAHSAALATRMESMKRACDVWASSGGGVPRGRHTRAAAGAGAGAGAAGAALARCAPPRRARAALPLLAEYARAMHDKLARRDALHAALVAGGGTDETQNRLAVASEALRADLADWIPKTRAEVKRELLDLATKRVTTLTQILMGWEHGLKLSTEANAEDLFKTVSRTAVQNLSPSKCRADVTPTETDRDFDDFSDSDFQDMRIHDDEKQDSDVADVNDVMGLRNDVARQQNGVETSENDVMGLENDVSKQEQDILKQGNDVIGQENDVSRQENDVTELESEILNQDVALTDNRQPNSASELSKLESNSNEPSRCEVMSDPLQSFSEVDLSS